MNLDALRSFLEILYFIAGIGLFVVAIIALQQIRLAKTDIKTRVAREAAKESAVQIAHWVDRILPSIRELNSHKKKINLERLKCSMDRFEVEELKDSKCWSHHDKAVDLLSEDSEFLDLTANTVNMVESSAMYFCSGIANEELAFSALSETFCDFVEETFYLYCGMRRKDELNRWDHTVDLYRKWSKRRIKHDLDGQQNTLAKALLQAETDAAPIPPLGV